MVKFSHPDHPISPHLPRFSLPGVTEAIPTYTSELTLSSQNFQPRPGRRKSALGLRHSWPAQLGVDVDLN